MKPRIESQAEAVGEAPNRIASGGKRRAALLSKKVSLDAYRLSAENNETQALDRSGSSGSLNNRPERKTPDLSLRGVRGSANGPPKMMKIGGRGKAEVRFSSHVSRNRRAEDGKIITSPCAVLKLLNRLVCG